MDKKITNDEFKITLYCLAISLLLRIVFHIPTFITGCIFVILYVISIANFNGKKAQKEKEENLRQQLENEKIKSIKIKHEKELDNKETQIKLLENKNAKLKKELEKLKKSFDDKVKNQKTEKKIEKDKKISDDKKKTQKKEKNVEKDKPKNVIIPKQTSVNDFYIFEYMNEDEYKKLERSLKKYNMLAYKKLYFEYYSALKEGKFIGELVKTNEKEQVEKYALKLPTDKIFAQVHGDITLHYAVYKKEKIIFLETITPADLLIGGHKDELTSYKGVMISKNNSEKDMFKINLLNSIKKDKN